MKGLILGRMKHIHSIFSKRNFLAFHFEVGFFVVAVVFLTLKVT